ncbi:hypothetical protein ACFQBQ_16590 [Granulicella cerasi]|uniref:Uncharacterized protein n=1 Tax=Granulicella cerasi TaxID=741063 RepID=A0ABW1ZDU4_9BACT|nr:hypothetical protein [Granulicella cerasi]
MFGVRSSVVRHLQSTLFVWYLHTASELQQSGDTGGTTASQQPSEPYAVEWANYDTPIPHWSIDFDLANSKALFTANDADDAAPDSAGVRRVPETVGLVIASGVTLQDLKEFSSTLRLRFFGPRDLTSERRFRSQSTEMVNGELGYTFLRSWHASAEFLNLLNRHDHDIDYAYQSRIDPTQPLRSRMSSIS